MPRVPVYQDTIATNALPTVRQTGGATAEMFGGDQGLSLLGKSLTAVGASMNDAMTRERNQQDAAVVMNAENMLGEWQIQHEDGVKKRQGQNAWGVFDESVKAWDASVRAINDKLSPEQQVAFNKLAMDRRLRSLAGIKAFERTERNKSLVASAEKSIGLYIADAAGNPTPENIAISKREIGKRVAVLAATAGMTPEEVEARHATAVSAMHTQIAQTLVEVSPEAGKAYFKDNRAEILGDHQAEMSKMIGAAIERRESKQLRDEARARAAQDRVEKQAADTAWNILAQTGDLDRVPAGVIARMDGRARFALMGEAKRMASGEFVATNWDTYTTLRQMAADEPTKFAGTDLRSYFDKLNPKEREGLLDIQAALKTAAGAHEVATLSQQLSNAHSLLGFRGGDAERKGQFDSAAYRSINAEQKRLGRGLSYDERQKVLDRLMLDGSIKGAMFGSRKAYKVEGTADAENWTPTISTDERKRIEAALKRQGQPVTDAAVNELFRRRYGL